MNKEPTALITAIGALLASATKVAVLLHLVDWDAEQLAGIALFLDSAILVLGALFIRSQVTPVAAPTLDVGASVNAGTATVIANK